MRAIIHYNALSGTTLKLGAKYLSFTHNISINFIEHDFFLT